MSNPPPPDPPPNQSWPAPPDPGQPGGYPPGAYPPPDNTLGGLIPVRNSQALLAYYLGVFSIIPCLGIPLGIAAFVLGLRGLAFAKEHPEVKGKTHAWVGIIAGGLFGFGYTILVIVMIAAGLVQSR